MDETVEEGAKRELQEETGVKDIYLEQFHVFSAVNRDPRERVLSVSFLSLVRKVDYNVIAGDDAARAEWFNIDELPTLAFDHIEIIAMARERLQELLSYKPIAFKLLDEKFIFSELQKLYEIINDTIYDRRNFQKKMIATGFLKEEGLCETPMQCRAPQMFSFDERSYQEVMEKKETRKYPFDF